MNDLPAFVRHLAESVAAHDPAGLRAPLPVGEIMQRMMPYRACRRVLGLESAEEYELLMLRLVAEEGGLARTWPAESAERCRVEVAAVLPDLSFLRELQEVTIQLDLAAVARVAAAPPPAPEAPEPVASAPASEDAVDDRVAQAEPEMETAVATESLPVEDLELDLDIDAKGIDPEPTRLAADMADSGLQMDPGAPEEESEDAMPTGRSGEDRTAVSAAAAGEAPAPLECPHCGRSLPRGRVVRFCQSCGKNVRTRSCQSCGAEMEADWRHCVECGHPAGDSSRFA